MNTYIIRLKNKHGYEWVADQGETEITEASSLAEALDYLSLILESLSDEIYDELRKDVNTPVKNIASIHLPLDISIIEIPATGKPLADSVIKNALQLKVNDIYAENRKMVIEENAIASNKQQAISQLKIEAAKLGLTLDDLK